MKTHFKLTAALLLFSTLILQHPALQAQPTAFTYQGFLTQNGGPLTGPAEIQFTLWDAASAGTQIAATAPAVTLVGVTNGLFTTALDFGAGAFNGQPRFIQMEVRTGLTPFTPLSPRQPVTAAPYAVRALTVASNGLSGGVYSSAVNFNNAGNTFAGAFTGTLAGNGAGLSNVNAATIGGVAASNLWRLGGNTGANPVTGAFLGTTDNLPFELRVSGRRALRIEDNGDGSDLNALPDGAPNIIAGSPANWVAPGIFGATIAGGGATNSGGSAFSNSVASDYSTIGGGRRNTILSGSRAATIAGGEQNDIGVNAEKSTIGGGNNNYIDGTNSQVTIAGGDFNQVRSSSVLSFIGGGSSHDIGTNSAASVIVGGFANRIDANSVYGVIGGGTYNQVLSGSSNSTIAGGEANLVQTNSSHSTISGGEENIIHALSPYATIAGGQFNEIGLNSDYSTIGGGIYNNATGNVATVAGGAYNTASGASATVAGGNGNTADGPYATVGGGVGNIAGANYATVSGGANNVASGSYATIPGGRSNEATNDYTFAAGRRAKANHTGAFVWADSSLADFASTGDDQFSIRAGGGVRVEGGTDAAPASGGFLTLGSTAGSNLAFDNNEIMARNNGAVATLFLNFDGGDVRTGGPLGVGRSPAANALEVDGNASKSASGSWLANSDARIKQEVQPVTSALDTLGKVRLVSFRYTDDYLAQHRTIEDRRYLNVIAQEFARVFPEHVKSSGEKLPDGSDILQVDIHPLTIYSAAAVQELDRKVETISQESVIRIQELKEKLSRRDAEIAELKDEISEIKQLLESLIKNGTQP